MESRLASIAATVWLLFLGISTSAPALPDQHHQQLPDIRSSFSSNSTSVTLQHATVEQSEQALWSPPNGNVAVAQRNNLEVGQCLHPDERIYTDNTVVENGGPSTLNGTLEIYIDAPIRITCIRIEDQVTDGTGARPWVHSGGLGESWVFVGVQAQYGKGFNFNIHIFGVPDEERIARLPPIE